METLLRDSRLDDTMLASVDFGLSWRQNGSRHTDIIHAPRLNLWRDILPDDMKHWIEGARPGEEVRVDIKPSTLVPPRDPHRIQRVLHRNIQSHLPNGQPFRPQHGRFYPIGMLRGIAGVFRQNMTPFRCVGTDADGLDADLNHPLSGRDLVFSARLQAVRGKFEEHGGTSIDWFEATADGPGMQVRAETGATDFFAPGALDRKDPTDDRRFYRAPRMVQHIDDTAIGLLKAFYGRVIPGGSRVLDLMSSWTSHLPESPALKWVVGVGMNAGELAANPRLAGFTVHDLNADPQLPFGDGEMDAVICSLSVEYLIRPLEVFAEVRRILRPGGVFAVTFSDRWFPTKAIRLWSELHPFERMGYVLELFLQAGGFIDLETLSLQGYPRPSDDKYAAQRATADPLFAVWGSRS